jgi:CRP-like cAMP-binding protein/predicted MFS family arabinose efflux permease
LFWHIVRGMSVRKIGSRGGSFRDALRNGDVRRTMFSQGTASTTQYLVTTALAIHLVEMFGSGSLWLLSLRYLPPALLGPLSALPAELLGPRRALITLFGSRAVLIGAAAVSLAAGLPVGILVALLLLEAAVGTSCLPAAATVQVAAARSPAELSAASALTSNVKSVSEVLGALAAGFLSALLAPALVFGVAGVVALVGAGAALGLRAGGKRSGAGRARSLRAAFLSDWRAVRDPRLAPTMALAAARASGRAVWVGLSVVAATGFLGMGTAGVGELALAAGVGIAVSVPAGIRLIGRPRLGALLAAAIAGMGTAFVVIAGSGQSSVALALIALWSLSGAVADMCVGALIPRSAAGRVAQAVAINETCRNWAQAFAVLLVPLSISLFGARAAVAVWGALQIAVAVLTKRALDRVDVSVASHIRVVERVHAVDVFRPLRVIELEQVAGSLDERSMATGDVLIREGDRHARGMFIIDSGTVEVSAHGEPLRVLADGDSFGEIALLHNVARTATVTATSDGELFALGREQFIGAVSGYQATEEALEPVRSPYRGSVELADALRSVPMLAGLDDQHRRALAAAAVVREVELGELLCAEGETATCVFVMLDGHADVVFGQETIGTVGPGDSFGEIGVLHGIPRTATIRASSRGKMAELSSEALTSALGHAPTVAEISRQAD